MCSTECHSSYMHNGFTYLVANHAADGLFGVDSGLWQLHYVHSVKRLWQDRSVDSHYVWPRGQQLSYQRPRACSKMVFFRQRVDRCLPACALLCPRP